MKEMKMMKYIVMMAVMVMISVCLNSTISHAEEVYETIPLNKTLSKTLLMDENKEAGNMYQVKIPKDGVAKLQIESPKNKEFTLFLMNSLENVGILDPKVNSPIISYAISSKEAYYNKSIMTDSVGVKKELTMYSPSQKGMLRRSNSKYPSKQHPTTKRKITTR